MDNFEDFEFRPLTDGLGFHKKSSIKKDSLPEIAPDIAPVPVPRELKTKSVNFELPELNLESELIPSVDVKKEISSKEVPNNIFIQQPLKKEIEPQKKKIAKTDLKIPKFQGPKLSKTVNDKAISSAQEVEVPVSNKINTEIQYKYIETPASFLSMFLDSTVIAGLAILFALGLTTATRIDLVKVVSQGMDLGTQIGLFLLVYSVSQIYYILSRVFFGQTLGEWSLENQVGLKTDQDKLSYVFRLCWRNVLLTVTGFLTLPILSVLIKKDLVGKLSGLKMYRQEQA